MTPLATYFFVPWLRRHNIENLRAEHVAKWAFNKGDIVVQGWCSRCGAPDHYGVVLRVWREGRGRALVWFVCKGKEEVGTSLLKRALPPYPKAVLDLKEKWKNRKKQAK